MIYRRKPVLLFQDYDIVGKDPLTVIKLPTVMPIYKDSKLDAKVGEVRNLEYDAAQKGIVGDFDVKIRLSVVGYKAMLRLTKRNKIEIVGVFFTNRPISIKYTLKRPKTRGR